MKKLLLALSLAAILPAAHAQSDTRASQGSALSLSIAAVAVEGSMEALAGGSKVVVTGIEKAGDSAVLVLRSASDAAGESVRVSVDAARSASVAVGTVAIVVALSTGFAIMAAGEMIAYVPNEIGKSLLHHDRVAARR